MNLPDDAAERIARAICLDAGEDPDAEVFIGSPIIVSGGCYMPVGPSRPAWEARAQEARVALQEVISMVQAAKS